MGWGGRCGFLLALLAAAVVFDLIEAPRADARAKRIVKKTDVCVDTNRPIPDGGTVGDFTQISVPTPPLANGSQVLDADLRVRVTHQAVGELHILLVTPVGLMVPLTVGNGGTGDGFGTGPTDCGAVFTIFDDQAPASIQGIPSVGTAVAGSFRPEGLLSAAFLSWADGAWRFYVDDTAGGNQGAVEALGLSLSYRCVKGRKLCRRKHGRGTK
jgi:subtilisin-like proprotein convertase family protein